MSAPMILEPEPSRDGALFDPSAMSAPYTLRFIDARQTVILFVTVFLAAVCPRSRGNPTRRNLTPIHPTQKPLAPSLAPVLYSPHDRSIPWLIWPTANPPKYKVRDPHATTCATSAACINAVALLGGINRSASKNAPANTSKPSVVKPSSSHASPAPSLHLPRRPPDPPVRPVLTRRPQVRQVPQLPRRHPRLLLQPPRRFRRSCSLIAGTKPKI